MIPILCGEAEAWYFKEKADNLEMSANNFTLLRILTFQFKPTSYKMIIEFKSFKSILRQIIWFNLTLECCWLKMVPYSYTSYNHRLRYILCCSNLFMKQLYKQPTYGRCSKVLNGLQTTITLYENKSSWEHPWIFKHHSENIQSTLTFMFLQILSFYSFTHNDIYILIKMKWFTLFMPKQGHGFTSTIPMCVLV